MKNLSRHSRVGGNPVVLLSVPLGLVLAAQEGLFIDWIPACAGMTKSEVMS
jgi:hypothetical protein